MTMSNAATDSSTTVVNKGDYLAQVNRGKPFTRSYNWLAACNEGRKRSALVTVWE